MNQGMLYGDDLRDIDPNNGLNHQQTIQTNDPNAKVVLKTVE